MYETGLYTHILYGTSVAVGFLIAGEKKCQCWARMSRKDKIRNTTIKQRIYVLLMVSV
jgi:hypothetical protein